MLKVHISPNFTHPDKGDGGIRRVWEAQVKHLPKYGVEFTDNPNTADLIACHGTSHVEAKGKPIVNHNHGLYWSRYNWGENYQEANRQVVEAMARAVAHTVPSEWVRSAVVRGMLVYPEVVYHGIDAAEWGAIENPGNYVLWNKARQDPVSDSRDLFRVARILGDTPFVSTLGNPTPNVTVIGKIPYQQMKGYIMGAGVYLATARETFGIGTLEALASGVPVAGWDWGGQSEIIVDGETGYLAPPGDFEALAEAIRKCFADRDRLSNNAIRDANERWKWEPRIEQYANLYKRVYEEWKRLEEAPRVSVVVTSYNLGKYIDDTLQSVQNQTFQDWECIVVDGGSEDDSLEKAKAWEDKDNRFKAVMMQGESTLALARNYGATLARGRYLKFLDADDMLDEQALRIEADALDQNNGLHIVYGHLDIVNEHGEERRRNQNVRNNQVVDEWPYEFSWREQMAHLNQLPYCAMMRKDAFVRTGGYRKRHWRAEDAALWCRMTSFGFRAKKVTNRSLLIYRNRGDSKSKGEPGDGDWTAWYPWRMGSSNPKEAAQILGRLRKGWVPQPAIVPFGAQGKPPQNMKFWYVHDYAYPRVSVIITVGPGHARFLEDALDSLMAQSYPDWECIVVNDTGEDWGEGLNNPVRGAPWAKVVKMSGGSGPSAARNAGFQHARGEAVAFLDADDYWLDGFLERTVAQLESFDGIIYTDWLRNDSDGSPLQYFATNDFSCGAVLRKMHTAGTSVLVPRWIHEAIGGWDEDLHGWEDWDYMIAAQAVAGACSYRVDEPLFVYRFRVGNMRETAFGKKDSLLEYIRNKWLPYYLGEKTVACGCKGRPQKVTTKPSSIFSSSGAFEHNSREVRTDSSATMIFVEYRGPHELINVLGRATGQRYRFGRQPEHRRKWIMIEDAPLLLNRMTVDGPEFVRIEPDDSVIPQKYKDLQPASEALMPGMEI